MVDALYGGIAILLQQYSFPQKILYLKYSITTMLASSSCRLASRRLMSRQATQRMSTFCARTIATSTAMVRNSKGAATTATWSLMALATGGVASVAIVVSNNNNNNNKTFLDAARVPTGGDLPALSSGTPVKEPATGILFPQLCNGYYLAGCGVRIKYAFVKVYAVGSYFDPLAMSAVKKSGQAAIEEALLDPNYPRTIRIVMNRGLSVDKFTAAIVEALEPRMMGRDLGSLDEFKKLNPPVDLVQGAEIEMTIRGDTLLYRNAVGGVGSIRSAVFTKAMCDVYYGSDPVSPTHKAAVLEGIPKL